VERYVLYNIKTERLICFVTSGEGVVFKDITEGKKE
jgi:hypothetical protein